jgi:DNA-directed RNA polymerase subunit alpha
MAVKYGKFELPSKIKVDESSRKQHHVRFIAEPFERGFGHTIGNALRRIMLSSLEAPAIVSVRIEGVQHEYMAIDGIVEDMTHIVLNLKGALLRKLALEEDDETREFRIVTKVLDITPQQIEKAGGQYLVTLRDLLGDTDYDLVNPDLLIFTATKPFIKRIDLKIGVGRGYVPSERHQVLDKVVDEIIIDSAYSPVRMVNYFVENTRVGQDTDYDRLLLDVTTDGRISPEEALTFATQIGILHLGVFDQIKMHSITFERDQIELSTDRDALMAKLALKISEIELSVRSTNCLAGADIDTIAELVIMPESEMLKFRNFGKKSLNEIKAKLEEMGLYLGMDLGKFGITRENVKQSITDYLAEKAGKEG